MKDRIFQDSEAFSDILLYCEMGKLRRESLLLRIIDYFRSFSKKTYFQRAQEKAEEMLSIAKKDRTANLNSSDKKLIDIRIKFYEDVIAAPENINAVVADFLEGTLKNGLTCNGSQEEHLSLIESYREDID